MDLDSQVNNNVEKSTNSCPGSGSENVVDSATTTTTTTAKNDEDDHVKKEKAEESTAAAGQDVDNELGDDHDNGSKKKLKPLQMPAAVSKAVPAGALPGGPKKGTTTSPTITTGKSAALPQLSPPGSSPVLKTPPVHQTGINNPAGAAAGGGPAWHMMNKGGAAAAAAPAGPATSAGSSSYGPDSYNSNNMQNANDGATFVPGNKGPQHVAAPPTGGPYGSGKSRNYPHGMNKGHHQHHSAMKGGPAPAPHYQQHHFINMNCKSIVLV